jgi:sporulation protein YlmC with PRC-barrel domain
MLLTIQNMLGAPVMSLQTGRPLAKLDAAIVDPHNLKIVAFYVSGPMVDFSPAVLFSNDIREFGELGAIIDSTDDILPLDDLVRLQEIIDLHFQLDGIQVIDDHRRKLGRVDNYTLNPEDFLIQQLYLKPSLVKSFSVAHLTVGRAQIVAIDNQKITVKAPTEPTTERAEVRAAQAQPFENPFRKPTGEEKPDKPAKPAKAPAPEAADASRADQVSDKSA